jgi:hypothetical protein
MTDIDLDAREQLMNALARQGVEFRDRLADAVEIAGSQLEYLRPAVLGATKRGIFAGSAAYVQRGAILVVIADGKRVVTIHWLKHEHRRETFEQMGTDGRAKVRELATVNPEYAKPELAVMHLMQMVLQDHGQKVGAKSPSSLNEVQALNTMAILLGAIPDTELPKMLDIIEAAVAEDVCPVMVCLVGKGTRKGTSCAAWPVIIPLAKYIETIE